LSVDEHVYQNRDTRLEMFFHRHDAGRRGISSMHERRGFSAGTLRTATQPSSTELAMPSDTEAVETGVSEEPAIDPWRRSKIVPMVILFHLGALGAILDVIGAPNPGIAVLIAFTITLNAQITLAAVWVGLSRTPSIVRVFAGLAVCGLACYLASLVSGRPFWWYLQVVGVFMACVVAPLVAGPGIGIRLCRVSPEESGRAVPLPRFSIRSLVLVTIVIGGLLGMGRGVSPGGSKRLRWTWLDCSSSTCSFAGRRLTSLRERCLGSLS
jgi:hypothetical protein